MSCIIFRDSTCTLFITFMGCLAKAGPGVVSLSRGKGGFSAAGDKPGADRLNRKLLVSRLQLARR